MKLVNLHCNSVSLFVLIIDVVVQMWTVGWLVNEFDSGYKGKEFQSPTFKLCSGEQLHVLQCHNWCAKYYKRGRSAIRQGQGRSRGGRTATDQQQLSLRVHSKRVIRL
jgi:hypothetical protein